MRKKTLQSILWHFCDQVLKKNLKLTSKISLIMQKKSFQIFQKEFFSNSTSFLLKKSYIPSNIAPFNYPGTLRVIGPGSGPGPGNGKSQKTGSGPGTPLPSISGYPGNSLPGPTLLDARFNNKTNNLWLAQKLKTIGLNSGFKMVTQKIKCVLYFFLTYLRLLIWSFHWVSKTRTFF